MTDKKAQTKQGQKKRIVKDTDGRSFKLKTKLGEGGQGVVCTTDFEDVLVKISSQKDPVKRKLWLAHVSWLMTQPLDKLNIAKPFSRIENNQNAGYVMAYMDGLMSLQNEMDESEEAMEK